MDFRLSEEQQMMRDSVRKLMDRVATPTYIREHDRAGRYPSALYQAWVDLGLLRIPFPEAYGGLSGSVLDMVIIAEEISRKSADFFMAYAGSVFCGLNVARKGSEEQKALWLPQLLDGRIKMSISMSEPDAGSDVGAIRTSAVREGDHYVINGQKLWATGAGAEGNIINVYARTDPKAHYRQGLSLFLVDNTTPGLDIRKLDMLGRRCTGTYEIFFNDVRVPADRLVGGENRGWDCVLSGLQAERITSAAGNVGAAQACLDLAVDYARERKQFGRPIGAHQAIGHMLADMATEVEAARALTWRAAWMASTGEDALREISMAKLFSSETYVKLANMGMQVFGAYGYNMEFDMQRHYRDSRAATVAAGSSQMQRNIISGLMGFKAGG
jgi:alkylation response protein AidB-like acyl-CoA dehydrogenase